MKLMKASLFLVPKFAMRSGVSVFTVALLMFSITGSTAAAQPIRNVLFLVSDDLKAHVLGCYGDTVCKTPNIDKLAARGMVFERAYCQGTVCGPSRTSFMRSRYKDKGGITMGEHFIANGFHSARVGKIFHMRVPGDIVAGTNGEDVEACWSERHNTKGPEAHTPGNYACLNLNIFTTELEGRETTRMKNRMFVSVSYEGDGSDQPDAQAADKAIQLLQENKDRRFFIAAGFVRPHYPSVAPEQYFDLYPYKDMALPVAVSDDLADIPPAGRAGSRSDTTGIGKWPDNQRRMWAAYYATVTYMDEQLGRVLDELDRLGLAESTAVVFASDHGYHLGEHTFWQKGNVHEDVIRVPLIIAAPGMKPGRSRSIVELVDIFPTLAELTGTTAPKTVQGHSLVPLLSDPSTKVREGALSFARAGGAVSYRTSKWAYMKYKGGSEELYDMRKDPEQFTNLAKEPFFKEQMKSLRAAMESRLAENGVTSR